MTPVFDFVKKEREIELPMGELIPIESEEKPTNVFWFILSRFKRYGVLLIAGIVISLAVLVPIVDSIRDPALSLKAAWRDPLSVLFEVGPNLEVVSSNTIPVPETLVSAVRDPTSNLGKAVRQYFVSDRLKSSYQQSFIFEESDHYWWIIHLYGTGNNTRLFITANVFPSRKAAESSLDQMKDLRGAPVSPPGYFEISGVLLTSYVLISIILVVSLVFLYSLTEHKNVQLAQYRNATQRLSSANEELAQFNYVVSHDLMEPLRTIASYASALESELEDTHLSEQQHELLGGVTSSSIKAIRLIKDLLAYTCVGNPEIGTDSVNIHEAIQDSINNIAELVLALKNGSLTLYLTDCRNIFVQGDLTRITLLIQNLIQNSWKFRDPNEPKPFISISVNQDRQTTIVIKDNGRGLEKHQLEMALKPFKRFCTESTPGTGMGLSICHRIVRKYGGTFTLSQNTPKGLIVTITLPNKQEAQ